MTESTHYSDSWYTIICATHWGVLCWEQPVAPGPGAILLSKIDTSFNQFVTSWFSALSRRGKKPIFAAFVAEIRRIGISMHVFPPRKGRDILDEWWIYCENTKMTQRTDYNVPKIFAKAYGETRSRRVALIRLRAGELTVGAVKIDRARNLIGSELTPKKLNNKNSVYSSNVKSSRISSASMQR